ncbi:MAG TPA: DUF2953 domain-containing protein [Bacilli bacterium]|nr:DUF2953 domain-containing protein [Bacilli bacterium]
MIWVWGILLLLGVLLALLLLIPLHVEVHYKRENKDDRLHIGVRALFGLIKLGYDVPILTMMERTGKIGFKKEPAEATPKQKKGWVTLTVEKLHKIFEEIEKVRKRISKYKGAIKRLTKSYEVESYKWYTMFGTGDAADTATISGLLWALKGFIGGYVYTYFRVKKRLQYTVKPHFQAKGFRMDFAMRIKIHLGKTIIRAIPLLLLYWKEGRKKKRRKKQRAQAAEPSTG